MSSAYFTDDTELEGAVDRQNGCSITEKDLDNLEKWANRNLINFN